LFSVKNANFFAELFGENIFKSITSIPGFRRVLGFLGCRWCSAAAAAIAIYHLLPSVISAAYCCHSIKGPFHSLIPAFTGFAFFAYRSLGQFDQIGRIFSYWAIDYIGQFFITYKSTQ
jgi:hypothetical protein